MEDIKKKRPMLSVDIDEEMRLEMKMMALKRNISLKTWVIRSLAKSLVEEKMYNDEHVKDKP